MNDISFENGQPVLTDSFDHAAIDTAEDIMREKLDQGMGALEIVEEYLSERKKEIYENVHAMAAELAADKFRTFVGLMREEKRPKYFIDQLMWLTGLAAANGISLPGLAAQNGVSKQAFQQASERTNKHFKFPKTRAQRDEKAKANMRAAYIPNHETTIA